MDDTTLHETPVEPSGDVNTDAAIRATILDRLANLNVASTGNLEVSVTGGRVTLEGTVRQTWHVQLAEDIASMVPGVQSVDNRLHIAPDHVLGEIVPGMTVINKWREPVGKVAASYGDSFLMEDLDGNLIFVAFHIIKGVMPGNVIIEHSPR